MLFFFFWHWGFSMPVNEQLNSCTVLRIFHEHFLVIYKAVVLQGYIRTFRPSWDKGNQWLVGALLCCAKRVFAITKEKLF